MIPGFHRKPSRPLTFQQGPPIVQEERLRRFSRHLLMFRKLFKLARASRERAFALVMLPAFLLGTLPQTACICADGHRQASCPMLAGSKPSPAGANTSCIGT